MSAHDPQVRGVVIGVLMAMFLSALDQTIISTAMPAIASDLGNFAQVSWVVSAYLLSSTCVAPIAGKLGDVYGRRQTLGLCLGVFILASVLCALAHSMLGLILARLVQGLGGGSLISLGQAAVAQHVGARERARYAAYFSLAFASASVLGPTLGGVLTEHLGWPWIFWINIPLGLAALLTADRALRRMPVEVARSRPKVDCAGIVLLCGSTVSLLLLVSLGGAHLPWLSPQALALGLSALILGAVFLAIERRVPEPILPLRFMNNAVLKPLLASNFIIFGTFVAVTVLAPVYLQVALGSSVSDAGLLMIPVLASTSLTSVVASRYSRRTGRYKRPPLISLPVAIVALLALAIGAERATPGQVCVLLLLVGMGVGPAYPMSSVAALNAVELRDLGLVSGVVAFARSLGGAIAVAAGSALLVGLISGGAAGLDAAGLDELVRIRPGPEARAVLGRAFGVLFAATALAMLAGLAAFARIEDRVLRDRVGPGGERARPSAD
jgi:EmrB/QacA subfamily drug resistance transporter